ncbi:protein-methionine-sulfoxide reductase heme-binding subunit MsrQ [Pseudochrobactrum kiredjianiae]|uniref:Protein-methionine-sulfoxide reductase heme-binding subunit MsrQ n=1 Tax=Pseudochrobactrum kiredjianiae TaxID=386305 RepID=A0ABW3VAD5_9HYPH|nr:protein-methionine-sulfoxide reductase heme-binding subunit MsrQ [Pseudochrobactrum kiredjianiae]MDM7851404.1 protein-methionine-sulfoxide reductase heme-binding subunit MsrQ [Pseudochrobactrum kiredjianiae]
MTANTTALPRAARKAPVKIPNNAWLRWGIYVVGLAPAVWAFWLAANNQLGANPVKEFEHILGLWALRFLILTLLVTPLRDLFRFNFLPYRRALGLLAFYYVAMHFATYVILDRGLNWPEIVKDVTQRWFIIIGFAAFILMIPLALTSNQWSIRKLKNKWQNLHRLIYLIALAGSLHFLMSVKSWPTEPLIYALIIITLVLWRVIRKPYLAYKKKLTGQ